MADAELPQLPDGIKKETIKHPPTRRYLAPQIGDEVEVEYTAALASGEKFESSKETGHAFKLKVGHHEIFEGFNLAIQCMYKGEQAKFTIAPQFAFADTGRGNEVPPNSTIVLTLELLVCPIREDLFGDAGAIKQELKANSAGRHPRKTDECQITYKVTVEGCGAIMASQNAVYKIGAEQLGQIAHVIDKALLSMKRGEDAIITCKPGYAFSENEQRFFGKVCRITLNLEEIYEVHDMSLGIMDGVVLRKRIKEGKGETKVYDTARVKVSLVSVTANGENIVCNPIELEFVAGDGELCDALEGSVMGLCQGDEAVLRVLDPAACRDAHIILPPHVEPPIMIHIKMLQIESVKDKWDMNSEERIERARKRKEDAAELFRKGRVRLAASHYDTLASFFARLDNYKHDGNERAEAESLRQVANLNRAACLLKLNDIKTVKELCTKVLDENPQQPKALFRRAKAYMALKEYVNAAEDLQNLLDVDPANVEGQRLLKEAKLLRKKTDRQQSSTFARMCEGLGSMPERNDRKDDDLVVAPNLEEEYARISQQTGVSVERLKAKQ
eukprot:TRINITY_DN32630_c0_g1_i1.p1 TRINITY_DN32630_c0_g1~~TRINITY_DN32630_c0_g1_i1.p1  ORF type:complete len:577 (+),score=95.23 TRINITY_DN32630_c0_g1_i1:58-1731(+)